MLMHPKMSLGKLASASCTREEYKGNHGVVGFHFTSCKMDTIRCVMSDVVCKLNVTEFVLHVPLKCAYVYDTLVLPLILTWYMNGPRNVATWERGETHSKSGRAVFTYATLPPGKLNAAIAIFTCHAFEIHGVRVTGHVSWSSRDVSMVWWVQSSKSHHKVLNQNLRGRTDRFWVHSFISDSSSTNHWADTLLMTKTIEPCLPRWTLKAQCKSNSTIL